MGHYSSQNLIVLDEVTSTNDYLKMLASKSTPLPEFTAIMARNQTAGRGQRDKKFFSNPGESLTFSFLLYPHMLPIEQHFYLTIVVSLGLNDWLSKFTKGAEIKWPNDIMLSGKKLVGILIESAVAAQTIRQAVVGIGVNIAQKQFPDGVQDRAISLAQQVDIKGLPSFESMCLEILDAIRERYEMLAAVENRVDLLREYNLKLFRRGQNCRYIVSGEEKWGEIIGADEEGKLHMMIESQPRHFVLHEITMVL